MQQVEGEGAMRNIRLVATIAAVLLAFAAVPALAGQDLIIPLKFIPITNPGKVTASLLDGISNKPVTIVVEDARQVKSKDLVGEGTGAGDDTFRIRYAGHLPSYLKTTVADRFATWGVQTDESSDLVLVLKVTRFHVLETHFFFGSTFNAEIQLPWTLADRAGNVFASGTALGTGKTKGRWRNPINCEEVLADALQQAAVTIAGDAKLQEAWLAAVPKPAPAPVAAARPGPAPARAETKAASATGAKTPAQLLDDVTQLRRQQLGTSVLVSYVSKQTLASGFSANDLVAWKKAGVPEPVMEAALRRAP
jgi:hypothetical protein